MKADWEVKKLGEIGNIFSGNSINEKEKKSYMDLSKSGLFYIATKDISSNSIIDYENGILIPNDKLSNFRIAHKNSVLICAEGGSAGRKFAFNSEHDICFVNKLFAFESKSEILSKFVFYYYQSIFFEKDFKNRLTGLIGGVSLQKFREISIPVPPLPEQKRIVEILDQKFAQIDQLKQNSEKNLQNAKELFQSELTKAFSNNTWEKKRLGEIITVLTDFNANGSYAKLDSNVKMYDKPNYAIIVRTTDLERNDFEHGVKYVDKKAYEMLSKSVIYGNEIIMNKIGSAGKIYLMPCLNRPATLARNAFLLRFNEQYDVRYIFSYLQSSEGSASIMKHVHGAVTKTITKDEVRSIEIPLPPLSEQQEIVAHLDALQEKVRQLEEIYTKQIANCDELKQSFLKKAFEGEL